MGVVGPFSHAPSLTVPLNVAEAGSLLACQVIRTIFLCCGLRFRAALSFCALLPQEVTTLYHPGIGQHLRSPGNTLARRPGRAGCACCP
jgi:hypothetical protein